MKTKILKAQKSNKNLWETYLAEDGPLNLNLPIPDSLIDLMDPYELVVEMYQDEHGFPDSVISIGKERYKVIFTKYSMSELMQGVKINSLLDLIENKGQDTIDSLRVAVENIANEIVNKVEHDSFFNDYSPGKLKEYIEDKILSLKDNFKIEQK
jgi:hypothetical protein